MSMSGEPPGSGDKGPPHLRLVQAYRPSHLPENLDERTVSDARRAMRLIYEIGMPGNSELVTHMMMTPAQWLPDPAEKLLKDKAFWDRVTGKGSNSEVRHKLLELKDMVVFCLEALYDGKAAHVEDDIWEEFEPSPNLKFGLDIKADVRAARALEKRLVPAEIQARAWIVGLGSTISVKRQEYPRDERLMAMERHLPELNNLLTDLQAIQKDLYKRGDDEEVVRELEMRFTVVKEQIKDRLRSHFQFRDENLSRLDGE